MIELEILVELKSSQEDTIKIFDRFEFVSESYIEDIYYFDPLREDLKPEDDFRLNASFRLRNKVGKAFMTYKNDVFEQGRWLYSDELETDIGDFAIAKKIVESLGLRELVVLKNTKRIYHFNDYEIVLEQVEHLGQFMEVELKTPVSESDAVEKKKGIQEFIDSLGLDVSEELNCGKPELFLRKNMGN